MSLTLPGSFLLAALIEAALILAVRQCNAKAARRHGDYTPGEEVAVLACTIAAVLVPPFWLGWFVRGIL